MKTMPRLAVAALLIAAVTPAHAGACQATRSVFGEIAPRTIAATTLSDLQSGIAKRIYAHLPPEGIEPEADRVVLIDMEGGSALVFFIKGEMICNTFAIPATVAEKIKTVILGLEV
jgi:hypothetical protein